MAAVLLVQIKTSNIFYNLLRYPKIYYSFLVRDFKNG